MGNSLHSDNPICPVNVIMPDSKFFNSIPKSPNPTPLPFEKRFRVFIPQFSALFKSEESEKIQISESTSAVGKVSTKGHEFSHLTTLFKTDCLNS